MTLNDTVLIWKKIPTQILTQETNFPKIKRHENKIEKVVPNIKRDTWKG